MKAPDKIYVSIPNRLQRDYATYVGIAWSDRGNLTTPQIEEYIRKDFLLEWAKQKQLDSLTIVADNFWQEVIDKINSL